MANKNKKRRRQGLVSKALNGALLLLSFARPIVIMMGGGTINAKVGTIIEEATFGLSKGAFNLQKGLVFYMPPVAATAIGFIKSYAMRKFPVRG